MPLLKRVVESSLRSKGFRQDEGDHHVYRYHRTDTEERTVVWTKTSHGSSAGKKDIDDSLISHMARQCKVRRQEFVSLIQCPLSREEYEGILRGQGFVR